MASEVVYNAEIGQNRLNIKKLVVYLQSANYVRNYLKYY